MPLCVSLCVFVCDFYFRFSVPFRFVLRSTTSRPNVCDCVFEACLRYSQCTRIHSRWPIMHMCGRKRKIRNKKAFGFPPAEIKECTLSFTHTDACSLASTATLAKKYKCNAINASITRTSYKYIISVQQQRIPTAAAATNQPTKQQQQKLPKCKNAKLVYTFFIFRCFVSSTHRFNVVREWAGRPHGPYACVCMCLCANVLSCVCLVM